MVRWACNIACRNHFAITNEQHSGLQYPTMQSEILSDAQFWIEPGTALCYQRLHLINFPPLPGYATLDWGEGAQTTRELHRGTSEIDPSVRDDQPEWALGDKSIHRSRVHPGGAPFLLENPDASSRYYGTLTLRISHQIVPWFIRQSSREIRAASSQASNASGSPGPGPWRRSREPWR